MEKLLRPVRVLQTQKLPPLCAELGAHRRGLGATHVGCGEVPVGGFFGVAFGWSQERSLGVRSPWELGALLPEALTSQAHYVSHLPGSHGGLWPDASQRPGSADGPTLIPGCVRLRGVRSRLRYLVHVLSGSAGSRHRSARFPAERAPGREGWVTEHARLYVPWAVSRNQNSAGVTKDKHMGPQGPEQTGEDALRTAAAPMVLVARSLTLAALGGQGECWTCRDGAAEDCARAAAAERPHMVMRMLGEDWLPDLREDRGVAARCRGGPGAGSRLVCRSELRGLGFTCLNLRVLGADAGMLGPTWLGCSEHR
ncbi:hypothetical protein CB1_000279035 [Camelus ferus]|nr:hypothetical protein CB1_000279035 [Camelus ferus]